MDDIKTLYGRQRSYFEAGNTRPYEFRRQQLQKLKAAIKTYEPRILQALHTDLKKHPLEAFSSEVGLLFMEISHTLSQLRRWMRAKRGGASLVQFPSSSKVVKEPLGLALIIAPWNYPFQLVMAPLVAAIAAGNCAMLKPSELAPATAAVIENLIRETFDSAYVAVLSGEGQTVIPAAMQHRFDHVLFTGSTAVGKKIMEMAAPHLTPVTLELGGKSPCIVDETANLEVAVKRIAWGKFWNAGQTCIAPDYILVKEEIKDKLVDGLQRAITQFFGPEPGKSDDYPRIINLKRFDTIITYLKEGTVLSGGQFNRDERYIAPTLLTNVPLTAKVMQEEIFGPVLPILTYKNVEEAKAIISKNPYPLSLYIFTNNSVTEKSFTTDIAFGGGCINNTLIHFANMDTPFGGVGYSGMGRYHGKYGFDTFSHHKTIVKSGTWLDVAMKYAPFGNKLKMAKWFMK
ncbi:aldehyde dehydrogenase [uncultured Chitinophaga sp.]|uniref:aldehyde dehydrogenase n=1 Tax=uncultured Chitinophaga sp. TaxID=339340 RepID=UPI0025E6C98D|nr:aldehyde dehydrogenase [uncultured Chitinophaga sp.]